MTRDRIVFPLPIPIALLCAFALAFPAEGSPGSHAGRSPSLLAASAVDSLRLESTIRLLSTTESGDPASRYAERTETRFVSAPQILSLLLGAISPGDTAAIVPFESARTDTPQVNVVARLRATGPSQGLVLLTAHYDATGRRGHDWRGLVDPAPGADDNASGVGCLIEAAHALAPLDLPFDVELVAFGSEEAYGPATAAPLEGSRVFAAALESSGELLLGVINADMIAFNPLGRKVDVVTNTASDWIAALFTEAAQAVSPSLDVVRVLSNGSNNSDHASFWAVGEDAVLLIENEFPDRAGPLYPGNPFYHTVDDTAGNLDFGLAAEISRAAIATVARLAEPPDGDPRLVVDSAHVIVTPRKLFVGDEAQIEVRVFNRGGPMSGDGPPLRVSISEASQPPSEGKTKLPTLEESIPTPIAPYFYKRAIFRFVLRDEDAGTHTMLAAVLDGPGGDLPEVPFTLSIQKNAVTAVRAINSPSRLDDPSNKLRFDFRVPLRPGVPQDVEAIAYDVAGRLIARHAVEPAQDGRNFLFWENFKLEGDPPGSGVYFVEVHLIDRASGAIVSSGTTKFLIVR